MKKNVKKVTIGILSCSLLLTMSACTKKRSAEEVLQDSLKASAKQENIDATGKVDCKIESGKKSSSSSGSSMNLALDLNLKGQNLKKDPKMSLKMNINMFGMSFDANTYYADGYSYTDSMGTKQKEKVDAKELQKQLNSMTGQSSLSKNCYKDVKLTKKDGNNVVAYSIDGKELGKYLKQKSNKNSKGTSNSTLSLDDGNIKSMKGSRTLNDKDLPLKESITLVVENKKKSKTDNNMFSGLTNGKTTVKINVTYKNPGKSVSVILPKDLSSYKLQKK